MNYKRAIGIGVLIYLASMIIGGIVCSMLGIEADMTKPIPTEMWITSAVLAVVLSIAGAYWYFKDKKLTPNARTGAQFGAAVIVVGFLLDVIFFLSLSFQGFDPLTAMSMYYRQLPFWGTLILILLGSGLVGWKLEKSKRS
jgi:drug/metabolite transporter (DMT)-like permease